MEKGKIYLLIFVFFFFQFMQKSVSRRLGCVLAHGGEDAIQHHLFFKDMKWKDLEDRKIKPPFKPKIVRADAIYLFMFSYKSRAHFCAHAKPFTHFVLILFTFFAEKQTRRAKFRSRIHQGRASSDSSQP